MAGGIVKHTNLALREGNRDPRFAERRVRTSYGEWAWWFVSVKRRRGLSGNRVHVCSNPQLGHAVRLGVGNVIVAAAARG
jgi:hypothetical protein